jgi:hypothetical protein
MDTPIDINMLFSEDGFDPAAAPVVDKVEEAAPTNEPVKAKAKEPVAKEPVAAEPVEEEVVEEEEVEEDEGEEPSSPLDINFLVEAGVLSEDPGNVDRETLLELIETETEKYLEETIEATFDAWKEKLPDGIMSLIQHTFNGGNADEFMRTWNETPIQFFDVNTESGQESFLRYYYKAIEGLDDDEVDEKIDYNLNRANLESTAKRYYKKLADDRDKKLAELAKNQVETQQRARAATEKRKANLANGISKIKEFGGYQFAEGEKKVLMRYATQPTVVEGKTFASGLAADLYKALEDPGKVAFLSKLLKSDFDTNFMVKKATTKVVKKIKESLEKPAAVDDGGVIWD